MSPTTDQDRRYMAQALSVARRGLGHTWPNPAVGCILVRDGRVLARGWTQPGGRPHAETVALGRIPDASGATAYVTLEPCAHHGRTPPCADALIDAGIVRAVVALRDPDPRVDGGGLEKLRRAGIETVEGVGADEAAEINRGFFLRLAEKRPMVTLKIASTLDGRIATRAGASQWITGDRARARGHLLRATHDAILIGAGTARADNPSLTCRLPGLAAASPVRVVADPTLSIPVKHELIRTATEHPTWIAAGPAADPVRRAALEKAGATVVDVGIDGDGLLDFESLLATLAERGVTRLLVEGGSRTSASFVASGLVDRIVWYRAPTVIGGDGLPAVADLGFSALADIARFRLVSARPVGADLEEIYERAV